MANNHVIFVIIAFDFYLNKNDSVSYFYFNTRDNKKNVFTKSFLTITFAKNLLTIVFAKNFSTIKKEFVEDVLFSNNVTLLPTTIIAKDFFKSNVCIKVNL